MYELEPVFWIRLFTVLGLLLLITFVFNTLMRKYLNVEEKKIFSHNHVNDKHKKIDWIIRGLFMVMIIMFGFIGIYRYNSEGLWGFTSPILLIVFLLVSESTRAFMEWKYSTNRNAYIFTLSQLFFSIILYWIAFELSFPWVLQ